MIVAAAVCPHPPLLFRELSGAVDVAADLRAACRAAVERVLGAAPEVLVVLGGADATGRRDDVTVDLGPYGGGRTLGGTAPLSLQAGHRLVEESSGAVVVEWRGVAHDAAPAEAARLGAELAADPRRVGLLVMGDGSARRGERAPGYLDDRAFGFDDALADALAHGDPAALAGLDLDLAAELLVAGRAAFAVLGNAVGGSPDAELTYRGDPFGVTYLVATWSLDAT